MSRGRPAPTFGIRVRLDFVITFDEPQSTLPVGGTEDGDAMFKAVADAVDAMKIPHAVETRNMSASFALDPRLSVAALAKIAKARAAQDGGAP